MKKTINFLVVFIIILAVLIACPPATTDDDGDDDATTTTLAGFKLTFDPSKAGGQTDNTQNAAEAFRSPTNLQDIHTGTGTSQKFTAALSTKGDSVFDVVALAEPATGVPTAQQMPDFWGPPTAKMTKQGTGATRKYVLFFDPDKVNYEAWGAADNINTKFAITHPNPTDLNTDKFYAMPPGGGNVYFPKTGTGTVKGKYNEDATDWGILADTEFGYASLTY